MFENIFKRMLFFLAVKKVTLAILATLQRDVSVAGSQERDYAENHAFLIDI